MFGTFTLTITLGNDAMQTEVDVAAALESVARKVIECDRRGIIRDLNGNQVGTWRLDVGTIT